MTDVAAFDTKPYDRADRACRALAASVVASLVWPKKVVLKTASLPESDSIPSS